MVKSQEKLSKYLIDALDESAEIRATLHDKTHNWLTNNGTNRVSDEDVGQALLMLMQWVSTKRLERLTNVIIGLTIGLIFLTIILLGLTYVLIFPSN